MSRPPRRPRDRRGRGLRGRLTPGVVDERLGLAAAVPGTRSRAQQFDDMVLDAVEHLERRWSKELAAVEFAVEDVPAVGEGDPEYDPEAVLDADVPLSRMVEPNRRSPARIVLYRRPLELRALDRLDLADLVLDVVVEQLARLLGMDPDAVDPPPEQP